MHADDPACYVCLLLEEQNFGVIEPAITFVKGTAVCRGHVRSIANADLLALGPQPGQRQRNAWDGPQR